MTSPLGAHRSRPRLVHLTTTDMSLAWLLAPQLEAFGRAGYEVIGISAPGPFTAQLEATGIRHVALTHATRSMAPHRDLAAAGELYRLLRQLQPEILHTHNPKPGWYGRPTGRLARVPIVVNTVHGLYATPGDPWSKRALVYGLERTAAACSDGELVQNPEDVEILRKLRVPAAKIHVLGNGIDLTRFDPDRFDPTERRDSRSAMGASGDEIVIGVVGRLVAEKGIAEVLGAAARLHESHPQLRWALIGPSDPQKADAVDPAILERARAHGVILVGEREDVDQLYGGMDLFVLASHREGFPRAAMEAAAMGVPIVATDIRGCRQVVDDGMTGRLVPAHASERLAEAVADLVADPEKRAKMAGAAREKAHREFDQQHQIDVTLDLYGELLARRSRDVRG